METEAKYTEGQELWARLDEGSLAKVKFIRTLDNVMEVRFDDKENIVLDPHQLNTDRQSLVDEEPELADGELEEIINAAANELGLQVTELLKRAEVYGNDRWGENTERVGAFMSAAYGAAIGVSQGWMADAPAGAKNICDVTARTIAINIMKQRDVDSADLEEAEKILEDL